MFKVLSVVRSDAKGTKNYKTMIKVGSDFSGVGAFNQALNRLGIQYNEIFACDMDKYARQTFVHNYGEPKYYPTNVYEREIPSESLDIYMTSPPCQAFSLAGKRLGKDDKRGILFFNSLEFIQQNQPRFFIFENVKGLLSDDGGRTFSEWVNFLGGKSVNGAPVLFPYADSVPYHLYWKVLNAKHHGVPQNRERVFLIGIRDDKDNNFSFPAEEHLTKRLKDVLQSEVDKKYFLSEKMLNGLINHQQFNKFNPTIGDKEASCITSRVFKMGNADNYIQIVGNTNPCGHGQNGNIYNEDGLSPTLSTNKGEGIKIKSATSKGYEEATEGDSINFSVQNSETRRGRVGKGVAQTLDTQCNQGVIQLNQSKESGGKQPYQQNRIYDSNALCPALNAGQQTWGGNIVTLPDNYRIRRLTPRECFRLMDFPDTFTWVCSDSQAYKQAGNSIVVNVLYKILKNLSL
jgi:DNA (cytosine-5)-methyltransferase 1